MLRELLARHRALRLGVSLVGASALVVGFASPAFATESTGGNAPSSNYLIVEGGSNTTYDMMIQLSDLFNESPGCDLASSTFVQPLDYGCPGINDAGATLSQNAVTNYTNVTVTSGSKAVTSTTPFTGVLPGMAVTDSLGFFGAGTTVKKLVPPAAPGDPYGLKLHVAATGSSAVDTLHIITTPAAGEDGLAPFGQENPFNDVLAQEPAIGSSNGILELEDQGSHGVGAVDKDTVAGVTVSSGSTTVTTTGSFAGVVSGDAIADSASPGVGAIPAGDTVASVTSTTSLTLTTAATASSTADQVVITQPINIAPLDAARSSRAPKSSDLQGLNFVAYAEDGVSWFHWTEVGTTATPSASVTNIPTATLTAIWEGTEGCTVSSVTYTMNWICLGGTNAPIDLYIAQSGSGTESTWASLLGLPSSGFPYGGELSNHVIFENETSSIIANGDEADAIFFFSYGKFKTDCPAAGADGYCGAEPAGWAGGKVALGQINGITVNQSTINAQLPGAPDPSGIFPGDRLLYNVYSDGENSAHIPTATTATLNAVSEDGFLCKPSTSTDVDPNTGATYLSEIDAVIKAQGFFPLPLEIEDGNGAANNPTLNPGLNPTSTDSGIPHPAWNELSGSAYQNTVEEAAPYNFPASDTDTDDSAVSGTYNSLLTGPDGNSSDSATATPTNPVGYCLTLTTDGNASS
jgi:hypothetical protein